MALNTVTLTWTLADVVLGGLEARITLVPTSLLQDPADNLTIPAVPYSVTFTGGIGQLAGIIACDNTALTPAPGQWAYTITVTYPVQPGSTEGGQAVYGPETVFLNYANGAVQDLSGLAGVTPGTYTQGVSSVFGRTGLVAAASGDYAVGQITGAAPLASPALTGSPTAPTQSPGDVSTKLATDAFVAAAVAAGGGAVSSVFGRTGAVTAGTGDYTAAQVTGAATAASVTAETNRATTAEALLAPKASPALTGTPTAPTASPGDTSAQIATDAFVAAAVAAGGGTLAGDATGPAGANTVTKIQGVAITVAQATLVSDLNNATARTATATLLPGEETVFTGSTAAQTLTLPASPPASSANTVTNAATVAVTLAPGTGSTLSNYGTGGNVTIPPGYTFALVYIAATWYVMNAGPSDFARAGALAIANGGTGATTAGAALTALGAVGLASPAFTGTPTAPTQTAGDASTKIATDAFVATAIAGLSGGGGTLGQTAQQTGNYTAAANQVVPCSTAAGGFTVKLPNAPAGGTLVAVKIMTFGPGNYVTVATQGSDVIDVSGGVTSLTLSFLGHGFLLQYTSGIWAVLADNLPLSQLDARYGTLYIVPGPTGATATDTPAVVTAITAMCTAGGNGTLLFQDGTYQVDSNAMVIRSPHATTVASASSGVAPSAWTTASPGTLTVASAAGFPSAGTLWTQASGTTVALVTYTGTTSTTFTGCAYISGSPSGTLATGGAVTFVMSNFAVRSTGATVITQAPNRAGKVNNTSGDLMTVADCTDFTVRDIALDALRDTLSPVVPLSAAAASGQPSVTVAAGAAASYLAGQNLKLYGGTGSAEQTQGDGTGPGAAYSLTILSITPGGGTGGGDLITFTGNLANAYTVVAGTLISDGYGPYAATGAYLTPYQTGTVTIAGRTMSGEDQQCCLHLINCQRFAVTGMQTRDCWESGIRCGVFSTTMASGCSHGIISGNRSRHGYDQGIGIWIGQYITVTGNVLSATGWAGVDLAGSDYCTVTGNQIDSQVYRVFSDDADGNGVAIDGGICNVIAGNTITGVFNNGIQVDTSIFWSIGGGSPTLAGFTEAGAASLTVSATSGLTAGGKYSITDGAKSEAIQILSVTSSTVVALTAPTRFGHAATATVTQRLSEENLIEDNLIQGSGSAAYRGSGVRNVIRGNTLRDCGASTIILSSVFDTVTDGNIIDGTGLYGILASNSAGLKIRGNRILNTGTQASPQYGISLGTVTDSEVSGNTVTDILKAGMNISGSRLLITGNIIERCYQQGILLLTGDSLTITGNLIQSCGGYATTVAGMDLRGLTHSLVDGNTCNSNIAYGINLSDNGAVFCQYNRIVNNTCRDDGTGVNPVTGATWTQGHGINEGGTSNNNLFMGNECDGNGTAQLTVIGAGSVAHYNIISGAITT